MYMKTDETLGFYIENSLTIILRSKITLYKVHELPSSQDFYITDA